MKTNPMVSIIFPFYNCEKFIKEALDSIKNISSVDFEIIAVNDGSTDNSLLITQESLCGLSIDYHIINRTTNRGCFQSRTEAIRASNGEYIAIMDADDIVYEKRFEKQLELLKNNRDIWCCGGFADKIDEEGYG